ncbi:cytoplasmic tRNA 2-thiolation protein 2-A [Planococcus citri]|uniref:cytoplasmic tRNA 2-thiolation protein 2-A n=1 Tax=Planococcus citri TaxID=170843 RepID=UPI0031F9AEE9
MCSVIQDDFELDQTAPEKSDIRLSTGCKKCTEKADVVLQKRHSYCKSCFLVLVSHKFRSTLGKTKLIKHQDRILVVSYGDSNSTALLHLLEKGMSENNHKRIKFHPMVLFIDETALWPSLDKVSILEKIFESLKNFDCYVCKLSSVYGNYTATNLNNSQPLDLLKQDENDVKLQNNFSGMKSATSKIDFILRLRYLVQKEVAVKLQCKKIFTPESGSNLAVRLLSDVILGRGSQISSDIGVCDTRLADIVTLRPLREITTKEVTFYNVFNELEVPAAPSLISFFNSSDSIHGVTEEFICGLQEEFPSTVYTIFHTGDKLKNSDGCDEKNTCIMCNNKIDATKCPVSLRPKPAVSSSKDSNSGEKSCGDCSCKNKNSFEALTMLRDNLCYGCNRLINDMDSADILPAEVIEKAKLKSKYEDMRTQIEDFLL